MIAFATRAQMVKTSGSPVGTTMLLKRLVAKFH